MATTHWQSIDDDYRSWITRYPISAEEFNSFDFEQRKLLRAEYRIQVRQQQQPLSLEEYRPALEFAKKQMDAQTEARSMSTAAYTFARELLSGMSIRIRIDSVNIEKGSSANPTPYEWTVEHNGQVDASGQDYQHLCQGQDSNDLNFSKRAC